jgi:tripartite-type tricarboxylate transporter receptor subunit TctC
MAGRVSLHIVLLQSHIANIKAGKVKPIGIASARRAARYPDIPTFAEAVPGFDVPSVNGIVVPSATPRSTVQRVSADINKALQSPALVERMEQMGMEPYGSTPEQFDAFIRAEIVKWAKVVKASGAKAD